MEEALELALGVGAVFTCLCVGGVLIIKYFERKFKPLEKDVDLSQEEKYKSLQKKSKVKSKEE